LTKQNYFIIFNKIFASSRNIHQGKVKNKFMANQQFLKPGKKIDIIFENEILQKNAHYLKAVIYDYEGTKIIISQTSPALDMNFINRRILITFLMNNNGRLTRFGFSAVFIDLIKDYEIASKKKVEALIMQQKEEAGPLDFRMYFRVKPPQGSDLSLFHNEEKFNLLDISLGGAKFTHNKKQLFRPADSIDLTLIIGGATFDLKTKVREVWDPDETGFSGTNLQYVSVEFTDINRQMEALLGRAILTIERELLSEGKL